MLDVHNAAGGFGREGPCACGEKGGGEGTGREVGASGRFFGARGRF